MYITVTMKEVDALVACGVDIVAVQGTGARRPDGSSAPEFIRAVKEKYPQQLVMADCATLEEGIACAEAGLILWVLRCVATHRRQKDATISIMHLSMNFPKNALQRSLQRDISITRNRQKSVGSGCICPGSRRGNHKTCGDHIKICFGDPEIREQIERCYKKTVMVDFM